MYIFKNALVSITRNKGRSLLVGIIILVIACAVSVTLAINNSAENIILSMDVSNVKIANKEQKAVKLMESVGLSASQKDRRILKLSGGEQQRVAIARSLSYNPKMIIADEPTGNLDKDTENEILKILKHLAHQEGKCVIIVTHSENVCRASDAVYELRKSK